MGRGIVTGMPGFARGGVGTFGQETGRWRWLVAVELHAEGAIQLARWAMRGRFCRVSMSKANCTERVSCFEYPTVRRDGVAALVWVDAVCGGSPVDGMAVFERIGSLRRNFTRKVQFAALIGTLRKSCGGGGALRHAGTMGDADRVL